ncbi:hypothetical protein [Paenibacillus sp. RC67]|uniref:hypothetical protein n=1 Tax=Paenibacillus sp. RC67 TaxID=3039392 RepID=UPI0024AD0255|nr:hypothetical protein [Paenibacillus sp. RC67]
MNKSVSRQNNQQNRQSIANAAGQQKTKEQLSDVYAAGTSDGLVQLENETISLAQDSKEK